MRICFVGDSLVNGTNDPRCLGWAGRAASAAMEAGISLTYYNLGVRGDTSRKINARIGRELAARLVPGVPGRVVLSFGAADAFVEKTGPRLTVEESVDFLWRIVSETARKWPVIMAGPPPSADPARNAGIALLAGAFEDACEAMGAPYLDFFTPLAANQDYMDEIARGDGIHPGAIGYDIMAELFMGWQAWMDWL